MRNVLTLAFIAIVSFAIVAPSYAVSESAVLFLMISPGARPAGMGEAFVGLADDATAVYYNPAGLAFQRGREITLMHSNWLPQFGNDIFIDFLAYRQHFEGIGTIGVNVTYLNLGEQFHTLEDSPEPVGTFRSYDFAVATTYGMQLSDNWAIGLGLRYIFSNLAPYGAGSEKGDGRAHAFAFDLATLYKVPFAPRLSLGLNLSNMGPKITYIDAAQADPLPTNLKVGFAYKLIDEKYNKLTLVGDMNKMMVNRHKDGTSDPFYQALFTSPWVVELPKTVKTGQDTTYEKMFNGILSGGAEYWYSDMFALRAGYYWDEPGKVSFISLGAGIQYHLYRFDFSYVSADEGHPLANTMRFSLTIGF